MLYMAATIYEYLPTGTHASESTVTLDIRTYMHTKRCCCARVAIAVLGWGYDALLKLVLMLVRRKVA
jgi:hypothetical protein